MRPSWSARRRGISGGHATIGIVWRERWWRATSSNAAPSAPAATTRSSKRCPDLERIGFPIAEMHADGSSVITKHPGTGGLVSVGTVTAQLLYEIGSPHYLNPDVTSLFESISLTEVGPDRVMVSGVRGEPPPPDLKVAAELSRRVQELDDVRHLGAGRWRRRPRSCSGLCGKRQDRPRSSRPSTCS